MLNRSRERRPRKQRGNIFAVLDVGTSKICCLIARMDNNGDVEIIGAGPHASDGIKAAGIIDMSAASEAIGKAVRSAENTKGINKNNVVFDEILVNLSPCYCNSATVQVEVPIIGHEVTDKTIATALSKTRHVVDPSLGEIIHAIPLDFAIDGRSGISDPRGMFGNDLQAQVHIITAEENAVRNLETALGESHIDIEGFCCSIYASGFSALTDDEKDLGCTLIDMGGGTTSFAVYLNGACIHVDAIPVGGFHVTQDIARGLTTKLEEAERIKIMHGSTIGGMANMGDRISVPQIGENDPHYNHDIDKSQLTGIIQPRIEEILDIVQKKLEKAGLDKIAGRRAVITGGASQLLGMREMAELILNKHVRLSHPNSLIGLPLSLQGPASATVIGLVEYVTLPEDTPSNIAFSEEGNIGIFKKMGNWLRTNIYE